MRKIDKTTWDKIKIAKTSVKTNHGTNATVKDRLDALEIAVGVVKP